MIRRAHPRSRGENEYQARKSVAVLGSSPLTRGKRPPGSPIMRIHGLIPAHAGKTLRRSARSRSGWAHPRSRGENTPAARLPATSTGSSPLTRGKRRGRPCRPQRRVAHPRSRGENYIPWPITVPLMGSSPLTRGKQVPSGWIGQAGRLIPAHAGKTPGCDTMRLPRTAHPRSRGENPVM